MRVLLLLFLFVFIYCIRGFGQDTHVGDMKVIATPNVASLGIFGQIPVSKYNGLPQIDIPLHTIQSGAFSLPVSLNYHAGGNRPDHHPGWTGMGFGLNASGYITRIRKGAIDEMLSNSFYFLYSYLDNYHLLADPNWSTTTYLDNALKTYDTGFIKRDWQPDEFMFSVNGLSGSFYLDHTGKWIVRNKGETNVVVETVETKLDFELASVLPNHEPAIIPRIFYKFVLRDPQGNKYVFGGVDNAIEFGRPNAKPPKYTFSSDYYIYLDDQATGIVATTWMLTSIDCPGARNIKFEYEREGVQIVTTSNTFSDKFVYDNGNWTGSHPSSDGYINLYSNFLTNPAHLKKISCFDETILSPTEELVFYRSPSKELTFLRSFMMSNFLGYADLANGQYNDNEFDQYRILSYDKWFKLDSIVINKRGNEYGIFQDLPLDHSKTICFNYIENTNERLKLKQVYTKGRGKEKFNSGYQFEYNTTPLPKYNSLKTDHWGFFNNNNSFLAQYIPNPETGPFVTIQGVIDKNVAIPALPNMKEPVFAYGQAEILNKIIYPTGGYSKFYYGPHRYNKYLKKWPFQIVDTTERIAGGLRIDSIEAYDPVANQKIKRIYHYKKNFILGQSGSSGILSAVPLYLKEFSGSVGVSDFNYWTWSIDPYNPMTFTNGNHVTYGEVTEEIPGSGYIVSKFTNFDGVGNMDEAVTYVGNLTNNYSVQQTIPGKSGDLERGLLLEESIYDNAKQLLKKTSKEYTTNPLRFQEIVRSVDVDLVFYRVVPPENFSKLLRASATPISTYYPATVTTTTTTYNGTDEAVSRSTFSYDKYRNVIDHRTNTSNGDTLRTLTSYPFDYVIPVAATEVRAKEILELQKNYASAKAIESVVQKKRSGTSTYLTISAQRQDYESVSLLPKAIQKIDLIDGIGDFAFSNYSSNKINIDSRFMNKQVMQYDLLGNPIEVRKENNVREVYLWGHMGRFPVARIIGSRYDTVTKYINTYLLNYGDDFQKEQQLASLRAAFANKVQVQIFTYTYDPLVGMTSETDAAGKTIHYEYDPFGRLDLVRDQHGNMLKKYCYNYKGDVIDCGVYGNDAMSKLFTRNNCQINYAGAEHLYELPAGVFVSMVSKADANSQALANINSNGQNDANLRGVCKLILYARVEYQNYTNHILDESPDEKWEEIRADMYLRFYYDAACTQPAPANDLQLFVKMDNEALLHGGGGSEMVEATCNGQSQLVEYAVAVKQQTSQRNGPSGSWQVINEKNFYHRLQESRFILIAP